MVIEVEVSIKGDDYVKRNFFILLVLCMFISASTVAAHSEPEQVLPDEVEIYFFHDTVCGSCDGTEEFFAILNEELMGFKKYPLSVKDFNIYHKDGTKRFNDKIEELGLDRESLSTPLMIVGGRVYSGMDIIKKNIREAYLVTGEDLFENKTVYNPKNKKTGSALFEDYAVDEHHATAVYFYRIVCDECIKTTEALDEMSETVIIDDKEVPLDIIRINTRSGNNSEKIAAFFDAYDVPDEDRIVPIIFLADRYLAGYLDIKYELIPALEEGGWQGFQFPVVD